MALNRTPRAFFSSDFLSNLAIASAIFGTGLFSTALFSAGIAAPANASVLVEPLIRRGGGTSETRPAAPVSGTSDNIVELANSTAGFSTLSAALRAANLGSILSGEGPFTLFAPTDAAFAALPSGTLEALLRPENRDLLVKALYNHVGYGEITSDKLSAGSFETFDGSVNVAVIPTGVTINNANVVQADVDASNGVIHAVDQVLLPAGFVGQLQARINNTPTTAASPSTPIAPAPVAPAAPRMAPAVAAPPVAPAAPAAAAPIAPAAAAAPAPQEPVRGLW
jgi:uncharacterized surface protein with fasciclin (FAS1) repeats